MKYTVWLYDVIRDTKTLLVHADRSKCLYRGHGELTAIVAYNEHADKVNGEDVQTPLGGVARWEYRYHGNTTHSLGLVLNPEAD